MTGDQREFFSAELSLLAFQHRVLALAEDRRTPLLERLRFLAIVSSNLDELYMVRMAELRLAALDDDDSAAQEHGDGLTARARLQAVERAIAELLRALARCAAECLADAARHGVQLLTWSALTEAERDALSASYLPMHMTTACFGWNVAQPASGPSGASTTPGRKPTP